MAKIYRVIRIKLNQLLPENESASLRKCQYDHWLANKAYLSAITVTSIYQRFTYKMAAKINWRRCGTKLRHYHPYVYRQNIKIRHVSAMENATSWNNSVTRDEEDDDDDDELDQWSLHVTTRVHGLWWSNRPYVLTGVQHDARIDGRGHLRRSKAWVDFLEGAQKLLRGFRGVYSIPYTTRFRELQFFIVYGNTKKKKNWLFSTFFVHTFWILLEQLNSLI